MEFSFNLNDVLPGQINIISVDRICQGLSIEAVDNPKIGNWTHNPPMVPHRVTTEWFEKGKKLDLIINEMGIESARAQDLNHPITTTSMLKLHNHRLYIMRATIDSKQFVSGILKIGTKNLHVGDGTGNSSFKNVLCILDFFVATNVQRHGYGHTLFNAMLRKEKTMPQNLAFDRPSFRMLAFLEKHYNLKSILTQPNKFVLFKEFFENYKEPSPMIEFSQNPDRCDKVAKAIASCSNCPLSQPFEPSVTLGNKGHKTEAPTKQKVSKLPCESSDADAEAVEVDEQKTLSDNKLRGKKSDAESRSSFYNVFGILPKKY